MGRRSLKGTLTELPCSSAPSRTVDACGRSVRLVISLFATEHVESRISSTKIQLECFDGELRLIRVEVCRGGSDARSLIAVRRSELWVVGL